MIALIQKVKSANVKLDKVKKSEINDGLIIYLGINVKDTDDDINYIIKKILNLRIFNNENKNFDLSIAELKLEILIIVSAVRDQLNPEMTLDHSTNPMHFGHHYQLISD